MNDVHIWRRLLIGYIAVIVVGGSLWVGLRSVYTVRQPALTLNQVIVLARHGHIRKIYLDDHSNASHQRTFTVLLDNQQRREGLLPPGDNLHAILRYAGVPQSLLTGS